MSTVFVDANDGQVSITDLPTPVKIDDKALDDFLEAAQKLQNSHDVLSSQPESYKTPPAHHSPHAGSSTPPPRRSVQFAREDEFHDASANPQSAPNAPETPDGDAGNIHSQRERLKNRMRSFGLQMKPPSHSRTRSAGMAGADNIHTLTPATDGAYAADTDGEAGDSSVPPSPAAFSFNKRKRKQPQPRPDWYTDTEPTTPMDNTFHGSRATHSQSPARRPRPPPLRRATMTDVPEGRNEGVSEDEGRARLAQAPGWKRRSSAWLQSGHGQSFMRNRRTSRPDEPPDSSVLRRLRRTGTEYETTPTRLKMNEAREKWKRLAPKVRTAMKMRRGGKEKGKAVDYVKSAELMAELLAGSPAAIIFASNFQPDELHKKKTPVLLEQLKIGIPTSEKEKSSTDRHVKFNINLEYGNGLMRMEWTISRYLTDFLNLHAKYSGSQIKTDWGRRGLTSGPKKLPRFPKSSFPMLKGIMGAAVPDDEDDEKPDAGDESGLEGPLQAPAQTPAATESSHARRGSSQHLRNYSASAIRGLRAFPGRSNTGEVDQRKEEFSARQRRKLEAYLREMIRHFMFRGGSNRLCRFLEISALGVHLAAEGGYHGKEGMLHLKKGCSLKALLHSKWFLVRESYIAYVTSPEETSLEDVFLVDPDFKFQAKLPRIRDQKSAKDMAKTAKEKSGKSSGHRLKLWNSERTLTLFAKNERQQAQFAESLEKMQRETLWGKPHRFESFAPIRQNVHAEWLVEGRDYMWRLSHALDNAENSIMIHDWWLSPELYLRRPPAVSRQWRLDRLLKRKAEQGVKIFIIMYRNINSAIPIDSEYSKHALLDLHPNVHVQRSPNNLRQQVFYWAHHEKICVIDNVLAFCGGVDLCFGRYDTPDHALTDDKFAGNGSTGSLPDASDNQVWPGKDYSNPRVQDFFNLDQPWEEMYDRLKTPRMPWHDIAMQLVGQPARDIARHFVQRWNFLIRDRRRGLSRPIPTLLPPSEFNPQELETLQLNGTCEVQMLRSCGEWSMGTVGAPEKSIQNAYLKLIEKSDHFVYIENQFFVSSCWVEATEIRNKIADALVERVKRAHLRDEDWAAVIVIPLMPGFQNTVDEPDGSSVRLIMECQYRSICRGDSSIFGKLRAAGIDPNDYIRFYSLRQWGKIGPNKALTTEQLYIHAKCMIVDDRSVIIGSANINERSMNGDHDSEVAAVVRDKNFIDSTMAGRPYKVAKFAHSLRLRLMREHLGLHVDEIRGDEVEGWSANRAFHELGEQLQRGCKGFNLFEGLTTSDEMQTDATSENDSPSPASRSQSNPALKVGSDSGTKHDTLSEHGRDSRILENGREVLIGSGIAEGKGTVSRPRNSTISSRTLRDDKSIFSEGTSIGCVALPPPMPPRMYTQELGLTQPSQLPRLPDTDDSDIGGPPVKIFTQISATSLNAFISEISRPVVSDDCMKDPLSESFLDEVWYKVAENNTKLYRQVFRCMPDDVVQTWDQYKAFTMYSTRFNEAQGIAQSRQRKATPTSPNKTGPPGTGTEDLISAKVAQLGDTPLTRKLVGERNADTERARSDTARSATPPDILRLHTLDSNKSRPGSNEMAEKMDSVAGESKQTIEFGSLPSREELGHPDTTSDEKKDVGSTATLNSGGGTRRRRRATTRSSVLRGNDPIMAKEDAEELLKLIQGNLVLFPYNW